MYILKKIGNSQEDEVKQSGDLTFTKSLKSPGQWTENEVCRPMT